jgi:hypothetical protein
MQFFRPGRVACIAALLLMALASSGCPQLNRQPDYLGQQNGQFSVPDPLPVAPGEATGAARAAASGVFDHASISIRQEGELPDQTRPAR